MIFQQFSLLNRLNVSENIAMPMKIWKYPQREIEQRVDELLDMVGLVEKKNAYPAELSGGQKQRVAIARALALRPDILLCDEATSALDPQTAKSIIDLLMKINCDTGITIIIVTHQMTVLKSCCQRISILEDGKVSVTGKAEDIFMEQAPPLLRLIGKSNLALPETGKNLKLVLSAETSNSPIISDMGRDLQIDVRILGGEMEKFRDRVFGTIIINIDEQDEESVCEYLNNVDVTWRYLDVEDERGDK